MKWLNELTRLFQTDYPIVQAPMLGVTTPAMVAAAADSGCLGSLAVGGLSPQRTAELIRSTRALTARPFAVNLFVYEIPPATEATEAAKMQTWLRHLAAEHGLAYDDKPVSAFSHYSYREQLPVLAAEGITQVSFTFGMMDDEALDFCRKQGMVLTGTATSVAEAQALEAKGIDVIVAQGIEAGGHRGAFLEPERLPEVGSFALIPLIADAVRCPVIAAGGIKDGRTLRAAMMLGAAGFQIGSALVASDESLAVPAYKQVLQAAKDTDSCLTRAFSGRWARGLRNTFMEQLDQAGLTVPAYPYQNSLTTAFRAAAQQKDDARWFNLWAGQSAGGAELLPAATILQRIIKEAEALA